jgi:bacteriocin-like protein
MSNAKNESKNQKRSVKSTQSQRGQKKLTKKELEKITGAGFRH